ncbi:MAG: arginase [Peptoniphilus sp.]|uniref:arginase n=1 Tax=Peptoniphilus sp. TaxID=1971214 RepID=UPI002A74A577|nr:arginase [Peptoniphilus sp.]MDY2987574.1 arginase [Peptoniphilus sp.]
MNKNISVIGAPLDMGGVRQGSRFAPDTLRLLGLIDKIKRLGLNIDRDFNLDIPNGYKLEKSEDNLNHLDMILEQLYTLSESVKNEMEEGRLPLVIGGDHTTVLGTMKGVLNNYPNAGLIYFDAHADINTTETSPSGNIHGMPIAALIGMGDERLKVVGGNLTLNPKNIVYVGLRDLDNGEKEILKDKNIKCYTIADIDELGIGRVMDETLEYLKDTDGVHVSFDVDCLDPMLAPGTGIHLFGGLNFREARLGLEKCHASGKVLSLEFVELNPLYDYDNKTTELLIELICAGLGEVRL